MPKITQEILKCAFYLYSSEDAALMGGPGGGSGFVVGVRSHATQGFFTYAVTNLHNLLGGHSVIRFNKSDGTTFAYPTDVADWTSPPEYGDLAALPIPLVTMARVESTIIPEEMLASPDDVRRYGIGPGDDIFMVGRFVDHDGGRRNMPAVRFGHISIDPTVMYSKETSRKSLAYVLDVHSRSGYSGSPVFFYRTPGSDLASAFNGTMVMSPAVVRLLAVHYAQFPEQWKIKRAVDQKQESEGDVLLDETRHVIEGLSGMTCSIPAWVLRDLLYHPDLVQQRQLAEAEFVNRHPVAPSPVLESQSRSDGVKAASVAKGDEHA